MRSQIRHSLLIFAPLLAQACSNCPDEQFDLGAADQSTLEVVRNAYREFEGSTSLDLCVAKVKLRGVARGDGRYNSMNHNIKIDPETADPRFALRHELCHALDIRYDLFDSAEAELGSLGDSRRASREGFADACADTPDALPLWLATDKECDADSAQFDSWFTMRDLVFDVAPKGYEPKEAEWKRVAEADYGSPEAIPEILDCAFDRYDDGLFVLLRGGTTSGYLKVDPWSGERLAQPLPVDTPTRSDITDPSGWHVLSHATAGDVAVAVAAQYRGSHEILRTLLSTGDEWSSVSHCPSAQSCLLDLQGEVWIVDPKPGGVEWSRLQL